MEHTLWVILILSVNLQLFGENMAGKIQLFQ